MNKLAVLHDSWVTLCKVDKMLNLTVLTTKCQRRCLREGTRYNILIPREQDKAADRADRKGAHFHCNHTRITQLVECFLDVEEVVSSSLAVSTNKTYTAIHNDKQGKPPPQKGLASSTLVLPDQGLCPILISYSYLRRCGGARYRGVGNRKTQRKNQKNVS